MPENKKPRTWVNAGEDYEPANIGVPGFEVADEAFLAQVIAGAQKAVEDKKNAKQVFDLVLSSLKMGKNLFL